jgi:chromosome segregation ATPase
MNSLVICPGCGFRGQLPDGLAGLKSVVCPQCQTSVPVEQLRRGAVPTEDASYPIWVDGAPGDHTPLPAEPPVYTGDYMKDEAERFAQYVGLRLGDLHKRRLQLAEAENRFESMTMAQKQDLYRARAAASADTERLKGFATALEAKETELAAREGELAAREAEVVAREAELAARESRALRVESRVSDADRRTAELRAAIDQLEARRAALAEERETLNRRAELLDRAELAQHRRAAELDEMDERLRQEFEEFERERERAQPARGRAG